MYLKNIELSGFKSFLKKSVFEFTTPISAIVGPNGSGKSNIAEAFRFVLGEQSMKSLRGKRGEDLIFSGSEKAGRSNRARVAITFDNSKRFLDIDYDEVVLERVVHRDGVNEYHINGSQVRLRDVIELLASANIGASGHHIISQGEADRILNAHPRERREMIEDALGLKIYHFKKQESWRKLSKTKENIAQVQTLRKEIAPHLRFLKKQMEKVEKAIAMKEELQNLYKEYLKREHDYIEREKKHLEQEKAEPEKELKELEKALEQAKNTLTRSKKEDVDSQKIIELEGNLSHIRREKEVLTRELGRLEGQIVYEEKRREKIKHQEEQEADRLVKLTEIEGLASDIDRLFEEAETQTDPSFFKTIIKNARILIRNFIEEKSRESASGGSEAEVEDFRKLKIDKNSSVEKLQVLETDEETFRKAYQALQKKIEADKDQSRDAEREVFRITTRQNELQGALTSLHHEENVLARTEEDFNREIDEAKVLIGHLVDDFKVYTISNEDEKRNVQEERRRKLEKMKIRLEEYGGGGDDIEKEYKDVSERDAFLEKEIIDLEQSAKTLTTLIKELEKKLDDEFRAGLRKINGEFKTFFSLMFGGGGASLSLFKTQKQKRKTDDLDLPEDNALLLQKEEEDASEEGVEVSVNVPRKKIKGLTMLSGGERALTSIALIFAMSQVNPPPFLVLDETDAALDEANSKRYSDMIESLSKKSQLILITHNRETMSRAGILYGVTMGADGVSKVLSVKFEKAVQVAK